MSFLQSMTSDYIKAMERVIDAIDKVWDGKEWHFTLELVTELKDALRALREMEK